MFDKLQKLEQEYEELMECLSDPNNQAKYRLCGKRKKEIEEAVRLYRELRTAKKRADDAEELMGSADLQLKELAQEEFELNKRLIVELEEKLRVELLPKDTDDIKDCIMEIRAGAGGEEEALFAAELARMYMRFAERNKWKIELLSQSNAAAGGYKEIIFAVR